MTSGRLPRSSVALPIAFASLLVAAVLAGCAATPQDSGGAAPGGPTPSYGTMPQDPLAEGDGHDHSDPAQHKFLWHYDVTAHDALDGGAAGVSGLHALDLQGTTLFGSVYGSHIASADGGLAIWDIKDPKHPVLESRLRIPGAVGGDRNMEATDDANLVVIGIEPLTCAGHVNPFTGALQAVLVDATDKANPVIVDAVTIAGPGVGDTLSGAPPSAHVRQGAHSITVAHIGDSDWAFVYGQTFRIDRSGPVPALVRVGNVGVGHDLYIKRTPSNATWGLSADEDSMRIIDLSDPVNPVELAKWAPDEPIDTANRQPYVHTADIAWVAGKTLVVVSSEDWTDRLSKYWVVDATDLADLKTVGHWANEGNHSALGMHFSEHNPSLGADGILSLAHYHGGVLQFDLRDPAQWEHPPVIAYATYSDATVPVAADPQENAVAVEACRIGEVDPTARPDAVDVYDVEATAQGMLYAADRTGGLYVFAPTADHPVYGAAATGA